MMPASRPLRSLRLRGQEACDALYWEAGSSSKTQVPNLAASTTTHRSQTLGI